MTERVAVLSDIHGVLPALEAVLAEPDVRTADALVLTGDLLAGPQPAGTLELLRGLGDRAGGTPAEGRGRVGGNADRELVELARTGTLGDGRDALPVDAWAAGQLHAADVEFLAGLPTSVRLEVDGLGPVLFCHATPRDDTEVVLADSRPGRWAEVLAGVDADVRAVVCGHTHMPFVRLTQGRLVINPGSVGMPYGRPGAHWALLGSVMGPPREAGDGPPPEAGDGSPRQAGDRSPAEAGDGSPGDAVTLRRTSYDYGAACARIAAESGFEGAAEWAEEYVHARNSAEDALAAFGPLDGRGQGRHPV